MWPPERGAASAHPCDRFERLTPRIPPVLPNRFRTVQLPAPRERSDFAALAQRLLHDPHPERALQLAPELHARLAGYAWPGNLRQVASVVRTACAMLGDDEDTLDWVHMPDDLIAALSLPLKNAVAAPCPTDQVPAEHATLNLQELSQAAIQQTLQSTRGIVTQPARQLGISRQTIYRKLEGCAVRLPS